MATSRSKKSQTPSSALDPQQVAKQIGFPVQRWTGNCYFVACQMLEKGVVTGEPRYGHWLGPVAAGSYFYPRGLVIQHGWIHTVEKEIDIVIDPTRWVFEKKPPYIYQAPDFDGWYDTGGNTYRELYIQPFPKFSAKYGTYHIPAALQEPFLRLTNEQLKVADRQQLHWLATQSVRRLGLDAGPVFRWLIGRKLGALIPIDNRRLILGMEDGP